MSPSVHRSPFAIVPARGPARLGQVRSHRDPAPVLGVLGGCGGAGATSLAAVIAARGAGDDVWPVLIDLDAVGGGIDVTLGAEGCSGARWSGLHADGGRLDPEQLAEGLPRWGDVPFLACDTSTAPSEDAVRSVLSAATAIGPVLVDLGRARTPAQSAALAAADAVVLVVPAEVRAITAASSLRAAVEDCATGRWHLVVRSDRAVVGADRVADLLGLPLAGTLGSDPGLRAARDRGIDTRRVRRSTARLARTLLDLAVRAGYPADLGPCARERRLNARSEVCS